MTIDTHTHIGFNNIISANAKMLLESMDKADIEKSLVFAGKINNCSTAKLIEEIAPHKDRLVGIGSISPLDEDKQSVSEISDLMDAGIIKGLKFYIGYEHYYAADNVVRPYMELLSEKGLPAIFHCGDLYNKIRNAKLKYCHPLTIDDLATDLPDLKIVIAHMAYPYILDAAQVCYKNDNVYADLSGLVYGEFDYNATEDFKVHVNQFIKIAGSSKKLLFGSDFPIADQKSYKKAASIVLSSLERFTYTDYYENAYKAFGEDKLFAQVKEANYIFEGNAKAVFKL